MLQASVRRLRHFSQVREKRKKKKKEKEEERTVERHFGLMLSCWLNILLYCKKKRERKKKCSEISSLFVGSSPFKSLLYFNSTLVLKSFGCVITSIDSSSFALICFSVVSLSLILAKRLIATIKHYKGILEIWLQLIFSHRDVRFSAIWGGMKTKDLVVYVKVNWYPLTSVGDQSGSKLTSTFFTG